MTIKENVGSILSNIYFIGYLIAFGILCYTKATYLKNEIDKLLKEGNSDKNTIEMNKENASIFKKNIENEKDKYEQDIKVKEKINELNMEKIQLEKTEKNNDVNSGKKEVEIIKINNKNNNKILKNSKVKNDLGNNDYRNYLNDIIKGEKNATKKNSLKIQEFNTLKDNLSENKKLTCKETITKKLVILDNERFNDMDKSQSEKTSKKSEKDENESKNREKEDLADYKLNELEYDEAIELDNRNFFKTY